MCTGLVIHRRSTNARPWATWPQGRTHRAGTKHPSWRRETPSRSASAFWARAWTGRWSRRRLPPSPGGAASHPSDTGVYYPRRTSRCLTYQEVIIMRHYFASKAKIVKFCPAVASPNKMLKKREKLGHLINIENYVPSSVSFKIFA